MPNLPETETETETETDFTPQPEEPARLNPPTTDPPTPPQTPSGAAAPLSIYDDFGSEEESESGVSASHTKKQPDNPDTQALRRIHNTSGYRDGITHSKQKHLQAGFDEGYELGARFGLRVGWVKGVVRGLAVYAGHPDFLQQQQQQQQQRKEATRTRKQLDSVNKGDKSNNFHTSANDGVNDGIITITTAMGQQLSVEKDDTSWQEKLSKKVRLLQAELDRELSIEKVFGPKYFDENGIWTYPVVPVGTNKEQEEGKEDYTFIEVVEAHPLLRNYVKAAMELAREFGFEVEVGPETEAPPRQGQGKRQEQKETCQALEVS